MGMIVHASVEIQAHPKRWWANFDLNKAFSCTQGPNIESLKDECTRPKKEHFELDETRPNMRVRGSKWINCNFSDQFEL